MTFTKEELNTFAETATFHELYQLALHDFMTTWLIEGYDSESEWQDLAHVVAERWTPTSVEALRNLYKDEPLIMKIGITSLIQEYLHDHYFNSPYCLPF